MSSSIDYCMKKQWSAGTAGTYGDFFNLYGDFLLFTELG